MAGNEFQRRYRYLNTPGGVNILTKRMIEIPENIEVSELFGQFDSNMKLIEKAFNVSISLREDGVRRTGEDICIDRAGNVVHMLITMLADNEKIDEQKIIYAISVEQEGGGIDVSKLGSDCVAINVKGQPIKTKTFGQKKYVEAIDKNTIVFGIGPAGTGKTYLAVAKAVTALKRREVSRIILTRPAVEAGEKLGFLPGDLQNKVDPYLRPLYDGMYEMLGGEGFLRYQERGVIEVAPLAYMRGRTLDNSFIILDEAQNTTPEQMKMFLTRVGYGSHVIVTGDITQIDLPGDKKSGLKEAMKILGGIEGIAFCKFTEKDVVRHPLVQEIIKAYARYDEQKARRNK